MQYTPQDYDNMLGILPSGQYVGGNNPFILKALNDWKREESNTKEVVK
jgi:hypothetical protein